MSLDRYGTERMKLEDWKQNYCDLADVPDDKKRLVLINTLCAPPWKMLVSMCRSFNSRKFMTAELFIRQEIAYSEITMARRRGSKF